MRLLIFTFALLIFPCSSDCQELKFINNKTGRITSFAIGDKIGLNLKGFVFPNRIAGTLTDFNQSKVIVNNKIYSLDRIFQIRHRKSLPELILGITGQVSLFIALLLMVPLLLPIDGKNFMPFLFFLTIGIGSSIAKEVVTGHRVTVDRHSIEYIADEMNFENP